jgi:hypothetical protein
LRVDTLVHSVSVMKTKQCMLCTEIIAVCSESRRKHKLTLWANCRIGNVKPLVHKVTAGLESIKKVMCSLEVRICWNTRVELG